MRSVSGMRYITRAGKWRSGIARYERCCNESTQRHESLQYRSNIRAGISHARGNRGFLGKRNLGRIITREISPNVRFQTRIIRTCIATSASVSASFSLPHHCVKRDDRGGGGRGFISYKLFRRRPTYLPYVRMYCERGSASRGLV